MKRLDGLIEQHRDHIYAALVFSFPIFVGTIKSWHSAIFLVLVIVSVLLYKSGSVALDSDLHPFFWLVLIFVAAAALSLINAADLYQGWKRLTKLSYFLVFFLLVAALPKIRTELPRYFFHGVSLAGPVMMGVALYQVLILGQDRATGITHPIVFGDIATLFALFLVIYLLYRRQTDPWILPVVSLTGCVVASLLSLSRGGWLVVPVFVLLAPILFGRKIFSRNALLIFAAFVVLVCSLYIGFGEKISQRLEETLVNVNSFSAGEKLNSPIGQRFLMWDIALDMFYLNPLIGSGLGDFKHDAVARMESGLTPLEEEHSHAHSIYFEALSATGLLGLVSMLMALILMPLYLFIKQWRRAVTDEQVRDALCGLITVVSFSVFGLSESWISRSPFIIVYCTSLFVFYSGFTAASLRNVAGEPGTARQDPALSRSGKTDASRVSD